MCIYSLPKAYISGFEAKWGHKKARPNSKPLDMSFVELNQVLASHAEFLGTDELITINPRASMEQFELLCVRESAILAELIYRANSDRL